MLAVMRRPGFTLAAPPPALLAIGSTLNVLAVGGATAIMAAIERRSMWSYGLSDRQAVRRLVSGTTWGSVMLSALVALLAITGHLVIAGLALRSPAAILGFALVWGYIFLMVGLFEELSARGYLQYTLARGFGFWPAAVVLSLAFGAVHSTNPGEDLFGLASAATFGLVACFSLRRFGSLWWAIGYHASWDWAQSYFYGTPDSGVVSPGHLLATSVSGPQWISGGTVGPEGSVFVFVVLVATVVVIAHIRTGPAGVRVGRERAAHDTAAANIINGT